MTQEKYRYNEPYLRDHLVNGEQILLGVTYASLAFDALAGQYDKGLVLERLLFHDPVVLQTGEEVSIELTSSGEQFAAVATKADGENAVKVAEGNFRRTELTPDKIFETIIRLRENAEKITSKEALYAEGTNSDIVQGKSVQVVEKVYTHGRESLASLSLSLEDPDQHHYGHVHPALLNGSVFAGLAGLEELKDTYIPVMIKKMVLWGRVEDACFSYGRLVKSNREILELDCTICNTDGEVLLTVEGFMCKRMRVGEEEVANAEPTGSAVSQEPQPMASSARIRAEQFLRTQVKKIYKGDVNALPSNRNFMDLGLDSTQLISLVKQMESELKVDLYPTLFFEYQNIDELSEYLS
ncbi:MAG: polyketide synthase dehydratase domain-containing protein, partial [Bacteroidota bacterium]